MSRIVIAPLALLASALTFGAFVAPAMAKPAEQSSPRVPVEVKDRNGQTLYCLPQETTGTRLPQQDCRTRAEWLKAGATFRTTARAALNSAPASEHD